MLQYKMHEARKTGGDLCVAWLDVANAFGSVDHRLLLDALRASGAGAEIHTVIQDLYRDNRTQVIGSDRPTDPIETTRGIRPGCPLSGTLFNLAIDQVIKGIEETEAICLAYADDLCLLCLSPELLREALQVAHIKLQDAGLALNANKCNTSHPSE